MKDLRRFFADDANIYSHEESHRALQEHTDSDFPRKTFENRTENSDEPHVRVRGRSGQRLQERLWRTSSLPIGRYENKST